MAFDNTPDNGGNAVPVTPPAPDPRSAIPTSAGDTSNAPTGDTPAAQAAAQPPMQLSPAAPSRSMFASIVHGLIGGALSVGLMV
jgi:hypothetical protein